jgi:6-phosphogluconate dehydrogenase
MERNHYDLGLIGLGVMGRNFLLNVADHGFAVAGYDLDGDKVDQLHSERGSGHDLSATASLAEFVGSLKRPRAVMLLVPAGDAVDSVLGDLTPRIDRGDVVVDAGNSHFKDTDRRAESLSRDGLQYIGTGVSGGEYGARHGPSIMPGGPREAYGRVEPILTAAAARVDGVPCVAHLGPGSAGHYVKMVHNGIEYGIMQLIAEVYDVMRRGLGLEAADLHDVFGRWRDGVLDSYLMEITEAIFERRDDRTGKLLLEVIRDAARQKGTGKWTSQDAMDLQVPTPTIDAAVSARDLSALTEERARIAERVAGPDPRLGERKEEWIERLHDALYAGMLLTYTQGLALIRRASDAYRYGIDPATVVRIWRGGCIIRAAMLEDILAAMREDGGTENLLFTEQLAGSVAGAQEALRVSVAGAARCGVPAPALSATLAYLDGYRCRRLPANLTQAQRDYFGSHTYERIDAKGTFHTEWRA